MSDKCSVDIAIVKNPYATEEWRKDNEGCQACLTIFIDQHAITIKTRISLEQKG